MEQEWQYQVRLTIAPEFAEIARQQPDSDRLEPLPAILRKYDTVLKCQYDAFADYVGEAEREGKEAYHLYKWTKATIENPEKKAKYLRSFTLYASGAQIYPKDTADALMAEIQPLVGAGVIEHLSLLDSNPANNPQVPERYR